MINNVLGQKGFPNALLILVKSKIISSLFSEIELAWNHNLIWHASDKQQYMHHEQLNFATKIGFPNEDNEKIVKLAFAI